jgi:hypothetical protein
MPEYKEEGERLCINIEVKETCFNIKLKDSFSLLLRNELSRVRVLLTASHDCYSSVYSKPRDQSVSHWMGVTGLFVI